MLTTGGVPGTALATMLGWLSAGQAHESYIYKVDTGEEQELAAVFGIRSIPSLLFIPREGKPQMAVGAMPKAALKEHIDRILLGK